jgi:O-antigen ligase
MLPLMRGKADRFVIPALAGFAPAVLALLTWAPYGLTRIQMTVLIDALPVMAVELLAFAVAWREGLFPWLRQNGPPRLGAAALAGWLVVAMATTAFVAPDTIVAIRWTVHWIVHLLFGFAVAFLCSRGLKVRDFVAFYLAGFLVYAIVFLVYVLRYWGQPIDWVHHLPAAVHIRHVGIYAAAMTGMSAGVMAGERGGRVWAFGFVAASVGFAIGLWTGSRGMALSVIAATVVGVALVPQMRRLRAWGGAALSLVIGLAAVAWLPTPNADMLGVARTVSATTEHEVTTGRTQIWENVIHAIFRNPLFGYGPGQMPFVAPFADMGQAHNLILEVLLSWGLAGFVCVLIAAFFYLRRALPAVHRNGELLAAPFVAAASILALSMIDAAMFHVLPVSIFAACAGMVSSAALRTHSGG